MWITSLPLALMLAAPAAPQRLAVLDVTARIGIQPALAQAVSDALLDVVRKHNPKTQVIGAEDIRAMMGLMRQKQQLGCQDVGCLTELGGALGAARVVVGTLGRFGDTYLLSVRLIDVVHSRVLAASSERLPDKNDAGLLTAIDNVVAHLFGETPPPVAVAPPPPPPPVADAALQPVFQEDEAPKPSGHSHVLALSLGAGALAALVVSGVGLGNVLSFESYAPQAHPGVSQASAQSQASSANVWANVGIGCLVLAAAGVTGAVITW